MRGALCMILAMMLLPLGDAGGKYLAASAPHSPVTMAWMRFAVGAALMAPVALFWIKETRFDRFFLISQLLRGGLLAATIALILAAVTRAPMAESFGAFFIGPAVSTVLAWVLLREEVTRIEWVSLALGFAGVILVIRPSLDLDTGTLYALGAGACYGSFLTATRWSAGRASPVMMLYAQMLIGFCLLTPFGMPGLLRHGMIDPLMLAWLALPSLFANLLAILAYRLARAAALAPLVYTQIVSAVVIGYALFDQLPGALAAFGLALILGSGGLLIWRTAKA